MVTEILNTVHSISQKNYDQAITLGFYELVEKLSDNMFKVKYYPSCLRKVIVMTVKINNL